jgi:hypothetical protein
MFGSTPILCNHNKRLVAYRQPTLGLDAERGCVQRVGFGGVVRLPWVMGLLDVRRVQFEKGESVG